MQFFFCFRFYSAHVVICMYVYTLHVYAIWLCALKCRKVTTSWNWWILSACLLVGEQISGKVLEQHFLGRVKIFCVFLRVLREEYFTLHATWDTQNYDLFKTWRSRRCGWEVTASQLLLIDRYLQTVRSLLLQFSVCLWVTVIDMYYHQHWQVVGSYASFMSPPWCWVWLMIQ